MSAWDNPIRGKASIVGVGQTDFGKALEPTAWELALEASFAAIADAGLAPEDIDGMARFVSPLESITIPQMVRGLGLRELAWFTELPFGGEASVAVVAHAAQAVASGQARAVLVYRALSQSKGFRFGRSERGAAPSDEDIVIGDETNGAFSWPYGMMSPGNLFALATRRYMAVNDVSFDQLTAALGAIAVQQRQYAHRNPRAMMRDRALTMDDYVNARMISWPLRLFDLCLENDGAVAFVIARSDQVPQGAKGGPVAILGSMQSVSPYAEPFGIYTGEMATFYPHEATDRLYRNAGLPPSRVRVAGLYDAASYMTMRSMESYDLWPAGQGWRIAAEVGIGPDAPVPVNTHGGHLSEAYIHGMNAVLEMVRQLRGESANQIKGADVALVGTPSGGGLILEA